MSKKSKEQLKKIVNLCFDEWQEKKQFIEPEIEVKFGTKGIRSISKIDYENVAKKLLASDFTTKSSDIYTLKIDSQYLDARTGRYQKSNIRVELVGLNCIQYYCETDNLQSVIDRGFMVRFIRKLPAKHDDQKILPADYNDFNFRVSYNIEESLQINNGSVREMLQNWFKVKKTFRYICRTTFVNPNFPFLIDLSYVRSSSWNKETKRLLQTYSIKDSNVFNNNINYEIEAELDHPVYVLGPELYYQTRDDVVKGIENISKIILSGLQKTNFPISYPNQTKVLHELMKLIHEEQFDETKRIYPSMFLGPSSKTLQIENLVSNSENLNTPNIRTNYLVTEKADGIRNLLFINNDGLIYLLNMNMEIIFTGAKSNNDSLYNSILDGELILHDKTGNFINLFACFDIYYLNKKDIRHFPFLKVDDNKFENRLELMQKVVNGLGIKMINKSTKNEFNVRSKKFYPNDSNVENRIFGACNLLLNSIEEGQFVYNTDGLIFTPALFGVGSDEEGKAGPKKKIGWEYSLKWKPPEFNTIDFLVTSIKDKNNSDLITPIFENGKNVELNNQLTQYKTLILRCGFDESLHGYINPCQDLLEEKWNNKGKDTEYKPVRFYPSNPEDKEAGICNIMLEEDSSGTMRMFTEEREVFESDMIVEFRYDVNRENKWRWIPLRVREDKTADYKMGLRSYGNDYNTANNNWYSIHYPVTEDMLKSGSNIPFIEVNEDVYYNRNSLQSYTKGLRNFHNYYVKRNLIVNLSQKGNTLIDFACGKGGDLQKWIDAKLNFVLGVDKSKDNLENRIDGACARYLNTHKKVKHMPYAVFLNGTSEKNIKNGKAMYSEKGGDIIKSIFGNGNKNNLPEGVKSRYGIGADGFDIASCQFAIHYLFEDKETFNQFLRNVSECTKIDGYFIGTTYDGKTIFNKLKKIEKGGSIELFEHGKKIWEIQKLYDNQSLDDDSSSLGYEICVFQETINQKLKEFLVNFDYLQRKMETYGFSLIDNEEAKKLGFPSGSAKFDVLFNQLQYEASNPKVAQEYKLALKMTSNEKEISFLNRYFIFKKIRNVDAEKIMMNEINELPDQRIYEEKETEKTQEIVKKTKTTKRKKKSSLELIIED